MEFGQSGATGATGPAGSDGTSVTIAGSVPAAASLPGGLGPGDAGEGYITEDDGHLHVWGGASFTDVGTVRGPDGPTGPAGPQGLVGATGAVGSAGAQGITGPTGATGSIGVTGATGPNSSTDLTYTRDTTTVTVESSTGNDATIPAADTNAGVMSAADKSKLDGVSSGATANATDAQLRDRSTHTGTQAASTISDFSTAADSRITNAIGSTAQAYDADLVAVAALSPSNDDVIQRKAGAWTNRTPAQVKTDLALTKSDVGLANADNTSDANKPVSTAAQTALNGKANTAHTHLRADITDIGAKMLILGPLDPVPGGTPVGTVIVRTT